MTMKQTERSYFLTGARYGQDVQEGSQNKKIARLEACTTFRDNVQIISGYLG
jgi:hypothetical protein